MLRIKDNQDLGRYGQLLAQLCLLGSYPIKRRAFDLIYQDKLVEVKTSSCFHSGHKAEWNFTISKNQFKHATHFLLVLLNFESNLFAAFLIPNQDMKHLSKRITTNTLQNYLKYQIA